RHQMHDAPFPLDLAVDRHHGRSKHDAALLFEQAWPSRVPVIAPAQERRLLPGAGWQGFVVR
ncbi:hypothetical protein, partial [Rhizobium skierniewicense]|uniref:hypothetical protein n=1 Tax=Rhizobium skierniewicense TaxID=984260 RepID=UPI001AED7444